MQQARTTRSLKPKQEHDGGKPHCHGVSVEKGILDMIDVTYSKNFSGAKRIYSPIISKVFKGKWRLIILCKLLTQRLFDRAGYNNGSVLLIVVYRPIKNSCASQCGFLSSFSTRCAAKTFRRCPFYLLRYMLFLHDDCRAHFSSTVHNYLKTWVVQFRGHLATLI